MIRNAHHIVGDIVRQSLATGAIKIAASPEELFDSPTGKRVMLNNSLMHLSYPQNTKTIVSASSKMMDALSHDVILATFSAGLPWAALHAARTNKPLCTIVNDMVYRIEPVEPEAATVRSKNCDLIGCTALALPEAMMLSKTTGLPIIYVRSTLHPFGNMIEGVYRPGQRVFFIEKQLCDNYQSGKARRTLQDADLTVIKAPTSETRIAPFQFDGETTLVVDDLISRGRSLNQAVRAKDLGACVTDVFALFNQSTPSAEKKASEEGLTVHSLAPFAQILLVAAQEGIIDKRLLPAYLAHQSGKEDWHTLIKRQPELA